MIKKILRPELFWYLFLVVIVYLIAYVPMINNYSRNLPGRTYLGFVSDPIDTLGNLTMMQRGFAGEWLKTSNITAAIASGKFLYKFEYFLAGNITRVLGLNVIYGYKMMVLVLSTSYIILIYFIVRTISPSSKERLITFLYIFFSTGIIIPGSLGLIERIRGDIQVFQRLTLLQPHYMLGAITSIGLLFGISRLIETKKSIWFVISLILGLIGSEAFAPAMVVVLAAIGLFVFLRLYKFRKNLKSWLKEVIKISIICLVTVIPLLYQLSISGYYDFNTLVKSEFIIQLNLNWIDYLELVGVIIIPAIIGIISGFRRPMRIFFVLASCYIFVHPFILFIVSKHFFINPIRFIQIPYFFFYAVLAGFGIYNAFSWLRLKCNRTVMIGLFIIFHIILVASSGITYVQSLNYLSDLNQYDNIELGYPVTDEMSAYAWLSIHGTSKDIVLSDLIPGTLLQALTTKRAYLTSWIGAQLTDDTWDALIIPVRDIVYREQYGKLAACRFLADKHIKYVFYGLLEHLHHKYAGFEADLNYPCLKEVYRNTQASVYEVK
jgi:hypothetical protein